MKKLHIKITLEYDGKQYVFTDDHSSFDFEGHDQANPFWWEEGNGGCDCNRSTFINRECDKTFPIMPCGHKIQLINQEFIGDWK